MKKLYNTPEIVFDALNALDVMTASGESVPVINEHDDGFVTRNSLFGTLQ